MAYVQHDKSTSSAKHGVQCTCFMTAASSTRINKFM